MAKSHKILIYAEGESEVLFFNLFVKKYIKDKYSINIECHQGDLPSFKRKIKRGLYAKYKNIFVLRDLKTQREGYQNYYCITEMKDDFTKKNGNKFLGKLERSYVFIVVCNEIESWALTCDKNTDNRNEKHIEEIYSLLKCNSKVPCMQKYIQKLNRKELSFDLSKNKSFKYFMDKLILCN